MPGLGGCTGTSLNVPITRVLGPPRRRDLPGRRRRSAASALRCFLENPNYVPVSAGLQDPQEAMVWEYPYDRGTPVDRGGVGPSPTASAASWPVGRRERPALPDVRGGQHPRAPPPPGGPNRQRAQPRSGPPWERRIGRGLRGPARDRRRGAGSVVRRRRVEFVLLHARGGRSPPGRPGRGVEASPRNRGRGGCRFPRGWAAVRPSAPDGEPSPRARSGGGDGHGHRRRPWPSSSSGLVAALPPCGPRPKEHSGVRFFFTARRSMRGGGRPGPRRRSPVRGPDRHPNVDTSNPAALGAPGQPAGGSPPDPVREPGGHGHGQPAPP